MHDISLLSIANRSVANIFKPVKGISCTSIKKNPSAVFSAVRVKREF